MKGRRDVVRASGTSARRLGLTRTGSIPSAAAARRISSNRLSRSGPPTWISPRVSDSASRTRTRAAVA